MITPGDINPSQSWADIDGLEDQLAELLSKLTDPLIQTVGVLMNRINEHVERKAKLGMYLGGDTIVKVIDESSDAIDRAAKVIEVVMESMADNIISSLDYKIETEGKAAAEYCSKTPGLRHCNCIVT